MLSFICQPEKTVIFQTNKHFFFNLAGTFSTISTFNWKKKNRHKSVHLIRRYDTHYKLITPLFCQELNKNFRLFLSYAKVFQPIVIGTLRKKRIVDSTVKKTCFKFWNTQNTLWAKNKMYKKFFKSFNVRFKKWPDFLAFGTFIIKDSLFKQP